MDWAHLVQAPAELLPPPEGLMHVTRKAKRPPALVPLLVSAEPRGRAKRVPPEAPPDAPCAFDSCAAHAARVRRCCFRDKAFVVAVPLTSEVFAKDFQDEDHEVVVIELRSPTDEDISWLDDEQVQVVRVLSLEGFVDLKREEVRTFVYRRVPLEPRTRTLKRALYTMCSPLEHSAMIVTLVLAEDLRAACPTRY
jgi:hypothetical protein